MVSGSITSWQIDGEKVETVVDFIFLGFKVTADSDCRHEMNRHLLFRTKVITNLDSVFKCRDITLLTKVHVVKAMVFPVIIYKCERWTRKKAKRQCFQTVGLEKNVESLLDRKIKPVNPKGNQL